MKSILLFSGLCLSLSSQLFAQTQEQTLSIDSSKITSQDDTDWFSLSTDYFVFRNGEVHDLGNVNKNAIIEVRVYDKNNDLHCSAITETQPKNLRLLKSEDSRMVSAKVFKDGALGMIFLTGDKVGNYLETVGRGITVKFRVTEEKFVKN